MYVYEELALVDSDDIRLADQLLVDAGQCARLRGLSEDPALLLAYLSWVATTSSSEYLQSRA